MTFGARCKSPSCEYKTHIVQSAGLDTGSQGIPKGFILTAKCGAWDEVREIDFLANDPVDCEECKE